MQRNLQAALRVRSIYTRVLNATSVMAAAVFLVGAVYFHLLDFTSANEILSKAPICQTSQVN